MFVDYKYNSIKTWKGERAIMLTVPVKVASAAIARGGGLEGRLEGA